MALVNGNGDAFRHALWTFAMTRDVGADFAKKWSDAHENGASNQQKSYERAMDFYNNAIGIEYGKKYTQKVMNPSTMADIVQKDVRLGKMRRLEITKLVPTNSRGEKKK